MIKTLSTRKLKQHLIDYAAANGVAITCVEFIEVKSAEPKLDELSGYDFDAVIFTSANAVHFFFDNYPAKDLLRHKIVYSVAPKTAQELQAYGIVPAYTAANAAALANLVVSNPLVSSVLHVCGNLKLNVIEDKLKDSPVAYKPLVVYETVLQEVERLNSYYDVVMFYSPSGVKAYFTANSADRKQVFCCIGKTTAAVVKELDKGLKVLVPPSPAPEMMIDTIAEYFKMQQSQTWPG